MSSQTASSVTISSVLSDNGSSVGSDTPLSRYDPDRWYFPKERLENTPSRKNGIDADKELTYRQQSANFIQDIGQRLQVNQLCINTAIVYMHRFYMFHSFTQFHRNSISAASIFLAAKVEEQPRKLEHVIKVAHYCLHRDIQSQMDSKSEQYLEKSAELVMNENILLQTLGFEVAIDHPHTHVVKCCQLVRASKDLAQTSYFMATNSLHLTTMCLQYKPTVVACVCIHLACKWSSWEIPRSKEGKDWFWYVDDAVTTELLEKLTTDFLQIFNKSPSRLKKKIISLNAASTSSPSLTNVNVPYHGFDSSPGQSRTRSPSPKRPGSQKPNSSQAGVPSKMKPHGNVPMPHHPMKLPYPPGAPSSGSNKYPAHPPHGHSGKPPHPGVPSGNIKDPHHPHHTQHSKNPYLPHGHGQHGSHGQFPPGNRPTDRPGIQASRSSSQQGHHGHGMHSKPPIPGSTSSSSSHPYSSSSSMKNMPPHNPSKPSHVPPGGFKVQPNQAPGATKNPSQQMFYPSQQQPVKKQYAFGGEFSTTGFGSNTNILSIEDRRLRRSHAEAMGNNGENAPAKRPRSETYASVPPLSTNSLFSPEALDSSKRHPAPLSSQYLEGTLTNYSKVPERSQNSYSGGSSEGIVFGSSAESKPDIRSNSRVKPSVEFQPPDLLQPIDTIKNESLSTTGNMEPPRIASLFSPEFTPSNSVLPNVTISPPPSSTDHKRDIFSLAHIKNEKEDLALSQPSSGVFSEGGSQSSFTGRLSNSPKKDDTVDGEDSHSSKSRKKKKEKHKHKHKDDKEKKHKKDKHKDKEKDKDKEKKEKHRSKDKHGSVPAPEVNNDVPSHKIKIKLGRDDSKNTSVHSSSSRHSSSKSSNSSTISNAAASSILPALKVKISSKAGRLSSMDDEPTKYDSSNRHGSGSPEDESPCCPGFGPCTTCNRDDEYRLFSSAAPQGLTMKFAKSKETSKSHKDSSSSSKDSKKSKDKSSKSGSGSTNRVMSIDYI